MIDYDQISSTLRNFGEGKHRINKKEFEQDWLNLSLTKEDLGKKYNLITVHDVNKFATECNLKSRHSLKSRFGKNKDEEVRKILDHVDDFNDIGISISKIEESGAGSRKKILEMIDCGYLILGDSTLNNEKVIFLNPQLKPRFFSYDLKKLKQMYLNSEVTTRAISNRLGMNDISAVSRIAKAIGLPVREAYRYNESGEDNLSKNKNKFKKLWKDPEKTHANIAEELGISVATSHLWREKLKLPPRTYHQRTEGQTFEDFIIEIIEKNNGAMSLDDFQKSVYFRGVKRQTYLANIFKRTDDSKKLSTFRLPVWLLSKAMKIENTKYNPHNPPYAFELDDFFKMLEKKKFPHAMDTFKKIKEEYGGGTEILDNVPKLQIFFLADNYDSLLLKIAEIITKIPAIHMQDIPEAFDEFSIYDNSRGNAAATRAIMRKKIPILEEMIDDQQKIKEFKKRLNSKKETKLPSFNENDSISDSFSKLTSNIRQNSLKELSTQIKNFEIITHSEKNQWNGYAVDFSFVVGNQNVKMFLPDSQRFEELFKNLFEKGQSPRDLLRKILQCVCYSDGDITSLCPHCHFALWNLYRDNNVLDRPIIQNVIENIEFLMKYMCKLEDIIFADFKFSDAEYQSISSLLQNKEPPENYSSVIQYDFKETYQQHEDFWKEIFELDSEKKNLLLDFIKSQKGSYDHSESSRSRFRSATRERNAIKKKNQEYKAQKNNFQYKKSGHNFSWEKDEKSL